MSDLLLIPYLEHRRDEDEHGRPVLCFRVGLEHYHLHNKHSLNLVVRALELLPNHGCFHSGLRLVSSREVVSPLTGEAQVDYYRIAEIN